MLYVLSTKHALTFTSHVAGERHTSSVKTKTLHRRRRRRQTLSSHRAGQTLVTLHEYDCDGEERSFGHEEVWRTEDPDRVTRTKNGVETEISLFFPLSPVVLFFHSSFFFYGSFSVHVRFLNATLSKGHKKTGVKTEHKQVKS